MNPSLKVILCDLDSTLSNTTGRAHLARLDAKDNASWIPYSMACDTDTLIEGTAQAIRMHAAAGFPIFYVSGRNVEAEVKTRAWLASNDMPCNSLRMRAEGDILNNGDYKVAYIAHLRSIGVDPVLMYEDHRGVAEKVAAVGVPVVIVNPGYDDTVGVNFNHLTEADFEPTFDELVNQPDTFPLNLNLRHRS